MLFDMERDPWERNDISADNADIVEQLVDQYENWSAGTVAPKWWEPHGPNVRKEEAKRQAAVDAACRGKRTR